MENPGQFNREAKYPAIDITRLGSEKLLQRVITEGCAGSHFFDTVTNSGMEIHLLGKMGLLARHTMPEFLRSWPTREIPRRSLS